MFEIVKRGLMRDLARLVSDAELSQSDFKAVCDALEEAPVAARKVGFVAARPAHDVEVVSTQWEGEETSNTTEPGDWVVTNLSVDQEVLRDVDGNANTYVIKAQKFSQLYGVTDAANSFGDIYRSKGEVMSVFLPGGFDILAPWGERQNARSGYLLLNGDEVYGNQTETFRATYERLS